jgi:hypothetical protein
VGRPRQDHGEPVGQGRIGGPQAPDEEDDKDAAGPQQLAIVGREKHSFDILALPANAKRRGVWDMRKAKGYECQTSAREDSVKENIGKAERWGVPMVWVAETKEVLNGIKQLTESMGEYMVV